MTTMQIIDVEDITREHVGWQITVPAGPGKSIPGKLLGYKFTRDAVLVKLDPITGPGLPPLRLTHHSMITVYDPTDDVPDSYLTDI